MAIEPREQAVGAVIFPMADARSGSEAAAAVKVPGPAGLPGRITAEDVAIKDLGRCHLPSPVAAHLDARAMHFVGEADKVLVNDCLSDLGSHAGRLGALPAFELAGPRNKIFF